MTLFELLLYSHIEVPTYELIALLVTVSFCLLFRAVRLGLLISFLFSFHMGWLFFVDFYGLDYLAHVYAYGLLGLAVFGLGLYNLMLERD